MTEQVRRHLKDVLEDDGTETGGTGFYGETLEGFINDVFDENSPTVTFELMNEALKSCGIKPVKDIETGFEENDFEYLRNKWNKYIEYLKKWAGTREFYRNYGESPLDYSEWCDVNF